MQIIADPVAAVSEADARGEIAEVFDDIRRTLGVGVVNLVWRHLATFDGGLAWAWACVRPAYVSGAVAREAEQMKQQLNLPQLPRLAPVVLAAAGVDSVAMSSICAIQASYDRSNAMNFLALAALAESDAHDLSHSAPPGRLGNRVEQAVTLDTLPPLLPLNEAGPELLALLQRLNGLGQSREDAIMPSMYRQLSYWPGYLALVWALIAPLSQNGQLQRLVSASETTARPHINAITAELRAGGEHLAAKAALRDFLERVNLPKMIVITRMLIEAAPAEHQSWQAIALQRQFS